ncbi:hypothetical protein EVAR_63203_1 [Eumeta japonica]|uniref:Uncharacterized protein n=1 Tax=Eumeta variegata TaxID=151549 RepID=A0A4C1ZJZ2_EUMVA|nr:hypothetical protein EVAR_63203_1 [Eumeta japonica]
MADRIKLTKEERIKLDQKRKENYFMKKRRFYSGSQGKQTGELPKGMWLLLLIDSHPREIISSERLQQCIVEDKKIELEKSRQRAHKEKSEAHGYIPKEEDKSAKKPQNRDKKRCLITEFLWPPSSSIIRLWLPHSTKVLGKTNQTSPNSMGLRRLITEFLWPPSSSIIRL